MSISEQLKDAIRRAGISQSELERRSGIAQENISLFLSGKKGFSLKTVDKLSDALNLVLVTQDQVIPTATKKKAAKGK